MTQLKFIETYILANLPNLFWPRIAILEYKMCEKGFDFSISSNFLNGVITARLEIEIAGNL
jgi:hypothetical protein